MLLLDILGEMKCIPQVSYVLVFKLTPGEFKSTSTGFFLLVYFVMSSQKKGGEPGQAAWLFSVPAYGSGDNCRHGLICSGQHTN